MLCLSSKSTYLGVIVRIVPLRGSHHPSYLPSPTWTQGDCAFEFPSESANESSLVAGPEKEMAFGFGKAAKESTHDTPGYQGQGGQTQSFESNLVQTISSFWFCFFPSGGSHFWDQIWFQGFWFCVNFVMIAEKLGTIFGSIFGTTFKKKTKPP